MGNASHIRFELRTGTFAAVDADAGVIRGVSVISVGEAKGHGLQIDQTTLEQVKACAETYANGLKVKMSHAGDAGDIVGFLSAFRIEGDKLLADLTLLKSSRFREYVLELATTIPDTFGLSIAFSGPVEAQGKTRLARCSEIYSADLVSEPAANPTGLFEAKPAAISGDKPEQNQTPITKMEDKKDPTAEILSAIEALSARLSKLETASTPDEKKPEELSAQLSKVADEAAQNAFKLFAAKFGTPPAAPSAEGKAPEKNETPKKFEELVRSHPKYSENKTFAIGETVAAHPQAHADYIGRCKSGEVILF